MPKILVTPRSVTAAGHPALERLRAADYEVIFCTPGHQPDEEELLALLPGCAGYLAGVEKVSARVLEAATDLRVISRNGVGVDNIDLAAAARQGIRVCTADSANARGVAELTLGLIFALTRSIPWGDRTIKAGRWQRSGGTEVEGMVLGLVGCGRIGRLVAELATAVGIDVLAYDLYPDDALAPSTRFRFAPLDEVLAKADVVSLHCPPAPDGKAVVDAAALGRMKQGVYLINTARYGLVDDDALVECLQSGHVAGAALDVFDTEPPTDRALVDHDRVIATPHVGGFTRQSIDRAVSSAVHNLLGVLRNDRMGE